MAPLNPNNTARMYFDYVTGAAATSREHTACVRWNPALRDVSDVQADFLAFLQALGAGNFRTNWRILGTRVSAQGSDFSVPTATIATLLAFVGTSGAAYDSRLEAVEDTFQGRSYSSGRRVDVSLYRAAADPSGNFRQPVTGSGLGAAVGNAVTVLAARGVLGSFLVIDGTAPAWKQYMNQNYNSYWESRSRTT